jgi:HK97 gp10 family phage protein
MEIKIKVDNTDKCLEELQEAVARALERCGMQAESTAKGLCPVDTGNLRNSITHQVDGDTVQIGTAVEYGVYVECGTGKYAAGGRQTPWTYKDDSGQWHMTNGQRAQPFLKPAVADHASDYVNIFKDELSR